MIYIDIYCSTVESDETQVMPAPDKWSVLYTAAAAATYMPAVIYTQYTLVYTQYKPCHIYARCNIHILHTLSVHSYTSSISLAIYMPAIHSVYSVYILYTRHTRQLLHAAYSWPIYCHSMFTWVSL